MTSAEAEFSARRCDEIARQWEESDRPELAVLAWGLAERARAAAERLRQREDEA